MSGTFILSWVCNGRRVVTDSIPHDADESTTNVAITDATRKDLRDMLQNLIDARRILSVAERGLADAKVVEADMVKEEIHMIRELREAHKNSCHARVVSMDKAKSVWQAKDEVKSLKNALYAADYSAGQCEVFSTIYGGRAPTTLENAKVAQRITAEKYTAAWAAFNLVAKGDEREAGARAKAVRTKAAHAEATRVVHAIQDEKVDEIPEAPKDSYGCPRAVTRGDVLAAYVIVNETGAIAEKANETAVSAEAIAISAFDAHLAAKDKANKAAAKTYAVTFAASHDVGDADTAAKCAFKKVCRSDVCSAWDTRQVARKDAVVARKHANNMCDKATKMLEDARALNARACNEAAEGAHWAAEAQAATMRAEAKII